MKMKKFVYPIMLSIAIGFGTMSFNANAQSRFDSMYAANTSVEVKVNVQQDFVQSVGSAEINWSDGVIKVTGAGAPPAKGSAAQKRLMAMRAAKADGYRQLLEAINGVQVTSETVVKDFVTESDIIRTQVQGLVKGAQQIGEPRYMSDGSVEIDMVISLFGSSSVASIVKPQEQKRPAPPTKIEIPAEVIQEVQNENYTGVIVDCRGTGAEAAMSPSIQDENGGEVYIGSLPVDPDYVINEGIVAYTQSLEDAKKNERAGSKPLIIKGIKVKGSFKADVVISNDDAEKLLGANKSDNFLKDSKVVILL